MSAPLLGRRVVIQGLSSKPELNNTQGVAESFDEVKCRYNVRLDATGTFLALKPTCLVAAPGQGRDETHSARGGGGMPPIFEELLRRFGGANGLPSLPGGLSPKQLGLGLLAAYFVLPRLLPRALASRLPLLALVGGGGYAVRTYGLSGVRTRAHTVVRTAAAAVSQAIGSPVSELQACALLGVGLFMAWRYLFASSSDVSADGNAGGASDEPFGAYRKGYDDGRLGRGYAPIADAGAAGSSARGAGWGLGSLFKLAMVGGLVYRMGAPGGAPWSAATLMESARGMNPMNALFLFSTLSSLFS